jgi:hypothetical protein
MCPREVQSRMDADCSGGRDAEGLLTHRFLTSGYWPAWAARRDQLMEKRVFGRTRMELSVLGFAQRSTGNR